MGPARIALLSLWLAATARVQAAPPDERPPRPESRAPDSAAAVPAPGAPPGSASGRYTPSPNGLPALDQRAIMLEYQEGNFETVIRALEGFQDAHAALSPEDSLFIAKYLGVVYSANPLTRERGKYYLYRMLELSSNADLVDLFVSESIESIFQRVRKEFLVRRRYRGVNDLDLARAVEREKSRDTLLVKDTVVVEKQPPAPPPEPRGFTGNINFLLGLKLMDENDWDLIRQHTGLKLLLDFRHASWPINIVLDGLYTFSKRAFLPDAKGNITPYEGMTLEAAAGVRKILDRFFNVRPFVGGGLSFAQATVTFEEFPPAHTESGFGLWAQGGIYWELGRHLNLGIEADYSWASILILNNEANAGGFHFGMLAGYHF